MSQPNSAGNFDQTQPYYAQGQNPQGQSPPQFSSTPENTQRKGFPCGCFLGGCLVVLLLVAVTAGVGSYFAYGWYQTQLAKYTSETPMELPSIHITEEEVEAVVAKFDQFQEQFEQGDAPQEFVITVDEINALIAKNPELRGRIYVSIVEDNLKADVSFPVDQLPGGKGRFFNGSVILHVELEDGVLIANVTDAEANGQPIPEPFIEPFRRENIAKEFYKDPEMARALKRCEQLIIESDRIILKVRASEEEPDSEADAEVIEDRGAIVP